MFILGSANFGNEYSGSRVFLDQSKVENILDTFEKLGGCTIDTAANYGNSHAIIASLNNKRFNIGTKISSDLLTSKEIIAEAIHSLDQVFGKNLSYILLHNSPNNYKLCTTAVSYLIDYLRERKHLKFGISIYYFEELKSAISLGLPIQSVQAPLNYLDRRFVETEKLEFYENNNIQVFYRSIFLQGQLLKERSDLPACFQKSKDYELFEKDRDKYQDSSIGILLKFALTNIQEDQMVLGIESVEQLLELKNSIDNIQKKGLNLVNFEKVEFDEKTCIPMNWT